MKKNEIKVGGHYRMKVSGNLTTVRVDSIREIDGYGTNSRSKTIYACINLTTGKACKAESAAKFCSAVSVKVAKPHEVDPSESPTVEVPFKKLTNMDVPAAGAEHRPDPTKTTGQKQSTTGQPTAPTAEQTSTTVATVTKPLPASPNTAPSIEPTKFYFSGSAKPQHRRPVEASSTSAFLSKLSEQPVKDDAPHLIVEARAGTGKTTTLIEGLRAVVGDEPSKLTPSPQQAEVWRQMSLSAGKAKTVGFCAFNKSIATELQSRVPAGVEAMTMHSLGFKAVRAAYGRVEVSQWRVADIVAKLLGRDSRDIRRDARLLAISKATESLVGLCKMNLIGPPECEKGCGTTRHAFDGWDDELDALARHYEIEVTDRAKVFSLVPQVLDACRDPRADGRIDYDDMIWLPVVMNLPTNQYDLLLVDECQDLNKCQQELAFRSGKRLVFVGDDRQAVYGFAGADAKSMANLKERLAATPRGLKAVPLTVTRRCGRAIVAEARKLVPDFEAHETCCEGKISEARYPTKKDGAEPKWEDTYCSQVTVGDMLLCRVNAPLVSQCFRFLKRGVKAQIQGRDVGAGLISTIKKLNAASVVDLVAKVSDWLHAEVSKEQAKRNPSEARVIALQDRHDCLLAFTDGAAAVEDVTRKIESVFTDDKTYPGVRLSSIHKAKGLESKRVFLLMPKGGECPHPMAKSEWQRGQEYNLLYVATTRAIEELIYVK